MNWRNAILSHARRRGKAGGSRAVMRLFAVLDPAREPSLYPMIRAVPRAQCLFRGPLDPALERVSPHLVPIAPGDALATRWRDEGRGQSWGILLQTAAMQADLHHHLRTLTRLVLPGKRPVLFRFWDPRVLRAWLPACVDAEAAALFGPITVVFIEDATGERTVAYSLEDGRLVTA